MLARLSSLARSGLVALSILSGLAIPAAAAPAAMANSPAVGADNLIRAQTYPRYPHENRRYWRGGRHWDGNRHWRGNRHWQGRRHWRGDARRYHRRHYRPYYGGSGIYFDFAVPSYRYYAPRRVYRGGGSAHVRWCHNRYRSYRAWDNTYQPYNGPRRQCWSPYS